MMTNGKTDPQESLYQKHRRSLLRAGHKHKGRAPFVSQSGNRLPVDSLFIFSPSIISNDALYSASCVL